MKYFLLQIRIRNGEYEYESYSTHILKVGRNEDFYFNWYVSHFYNNFSYRMNNYWFFNGGEVAASIHNYNQVTKEEYQTLHKYL